MPNRFVAQSITLTEGGETIPLTAELLMLNPPKISSFNLEAPTSDMAGRTMTILNQSDLTQTVWYRAGFDGYEGVGTVLTFEPQGTILLYVDVHSKNWHIQDRSAQGVTYA